MTAGIRTEVAPLPPPVAEVSAVAATLIHDGTFVRWANDSLTQLAVEDIAAGCLAWRNFTNLLRLRDRSDLDHVVDDVAQGSLIASVFGGGATIALRASDIHVTGRALMTTGFRYAGWLLIEGTAAGGKMLVLAPASTAVTVNRPDFIGLDTADNALVDIEAVLPLHYALSDAGSSGRLVSLPYEEGLTLGAVAVGGAEAAVAMLPTAPTDREGKRARASVLVQVAAAKALVEVTPLRAPHAGWMSRAAKLAGVSAASRACEAVREGSGAATFQRSHPINRLQADLLGLAHQAPTDQSAIDGVLACDSPKEWRSS